MEPFGDRRVPGTDIGLAKGLREPGPDRVIPGFLAVHLTSFWLTIGHPGHQLEDIRTSGQDWRTGMTFDMTASSPRSLVAPQGAGGSNLCSSVQRGLRLFAKKTL